MLNVHCKIKACKYDIYKDFYTLSARDKINSVEVYESDFIMDRILNDMELWDIWRFLLSMFNKYSKQFNIVKSSEYYNWNVLNSYYFKSKPITVSAHDIAVSIPSKIRKKYFIPDIMNDWKYVINPDLYVNERKYYEWSNE